MKYKSSKLNNLERFLGESTWNECPDREENASNGVYDLSGGLEMGKKDSLHGFEKVCLQGYGLSEELRYE